MRLPWLKNIRIITASNNQRLRSAFDVTGSLSFVRLVMMSSTPAKSAGMTDTRPKIHSFNQRSRLQSVLGMCSF